MDYKRYDEGFGEKELDDLCQKIIEKLQTNPKTANELAKEILGEGLYVFEISPKLQWLKKKGFVCSKRTSNWLCYWALEKKYRKINPSTQADSAESVS